jgi:putative endonuclease
MEGFIYLLESIKNNNLYLGSTNDPAFRINEHNKGFCKTTKKGTPWKCILIVKMNNLIEARKA